MWGLAVVPVGGGRAWPGFETTRRAKLAARTARGRATAHLHTKQPGPTARHARPTVRHARPTVMRVGARNASGAASNTAGTAARRHARQPGPQLGVTVPGMPAVLQATLWAGRRPPARQAARHAKQLGTPSSPARQAARPPQQGATVPGAPVEPHTTAGNQPEYAASSVARWTPPRPASWAAWVRHEKPSARYTASG